MYICKQLSVVLNINKLFAGATMASRSVVAMRDRSIPLEVDVISSKELASGVVVPMPTWAWDCFDKLSNPVRRRVRSRASRPLCPCGTSPLERRGE